MNEKLLTALEEVSDRHIVQAVKQKKHRTRLYLRTAAAVLAVVMLLLLIRPASTPVSAAALVSPAEYVPQTRPHSNDFADEDTWWAALERWKQTQEDRAQTLRDLNRTLAPFCLKTNKTFLTGSENAVWSPVNAYMALSMLAQTASGSTRQELLELLGFSDIETLNSSIQILFETISLNSDYEKRAFANSLWLDDTLVCHRDQLEILGSRYYAGVYQTNLQSTEAEALIQDWITEHTGGLLESEPYESADTAIMTLISTLLVNARWLNPFNSNRNTTGIFHSPEGDVSCTYMHRTNQDLLCSWGEDYLAAALPTLGDSTLWLILPDKGKTIADVLAKGEYLDTVLNAPDDEGDRWAHYLVNLSLPKFRVDSTLDLKPGLQKLGLRELFDPAGADFSETLEGDLIYAGAIRQSALVTIDEEGIQAASVTIEELVGAAEPPDEVVDFILDRPFLFVLTCRNIPLFAGVAANP